MMLADWYFCCCVRASPAATGALLCILETFENPETDGRLLATAFDQLVRMEVWHQLYALPSALAVVRRRPDLRHVAAQRLCAVYKPRFDSLACRTEFHELLDVATEDTAPADLLACVATCATRLDDVPDRVPSTVPYLGLHDFCCEVTMLAVLADRFRDPSATALLEHAVADGEAPLRKLLDRALAEECGRLPFLHATRIAHRLGRSSDELLAPVRRALSRNDVFEPDLLAVYAELVFLDRSPAAASAGAKAMRREVRTLEKLDELWARETAPRVEDEEDRRSGASVLRRLALDLNRPRRATLSAVFWQLTLWTLAADVDPVATSERLARLWCRPGPVSRNVRGHCDSARAGAWRTTLRHLALLHHVDVMLELDPRSGKTSLDPDQEWLFFSPWILEHSHTRPANRARQPGRVGPEALVRLLACSILAVRFLQLPTSSSRRPFLELLVHAADVLRPLASWIDFQSPQAASQLSLPLTGLAHFGKRQITMAGTGSLDAIAPREFLQLTDSAVNEQQAAAFRSIATEVLIQWVFSAYPAAVGRSPRMRWLDADLLRELVARHRASQHTLPAELDAELVERFLCPGSYRPPGHLDWRKAKDRNGPMGWSVPFDQLLLTPRELPPAEWKRPLWDDQIKPAQRLVRAIERMDVLGAGVADADWRREWIELLNGIHQRVDLSRFIRLRLLELLDRPVLADDPDGQELIALTLLEYGAPYDLEELMSRVFPRTGTVNETRRHLQQVVLRALCRELIAPPQRRADEPASDPRQALGGSDRIELFTSVLERVAWTADLAADLLAARAAARHTPLHVASQVDVDLHNDERLLIAPTENDPGVPAWALRGISLDPNRQTATLFHLDVARADALDLFAWSHDRLADLHAELQASRRKQKVVGVVAGQLAQAHGRTAWIVNVGLPEHVVMDPGPMETEPTVGDAVGVLLYVQDNRWRWVQTLRHLPARLRPGQLSQRRRHETWHDDHLEMYLDPAPTELDPSRWQADTSRGRRRELSNRPPIEIDVTRDDEGRLIPWDHDLIDLLLEIRDRGGPTVLALIDAYDGPEGERRLRFSRSPGENYVIDARQLAPTALAQLTERLHRLDDPRGLLVAFWPEVVEGAPRLALAPSRSSTAPPGMSADPDLDVAYPGLRLPFDERNVAWREIFDQAEGLIAEREGDDWFYTPAEPVPGFGRVRVRWRGRQPRDQQQVDFTYKSWDERERWTAEVEAQWIPSQPLAVPDDALPRFFEEWMQLDIGHRLRIRAVEGAIQHLRDGYVRCYSSENLPVRLEGGSLSFLELGDRAPLGGNSRTPREAEVTKVERIAGVDLVAAADEIPEAAVTMGYCHGLIVSAPSPGGTQSEVLWHTETGCLRSPLTIYNTNKIRPPLGSVVTGTARDGRWRFQLEVRKVYARALWTVSERDALPPGATYLGAAGSEHLAELEPGKLATIPDPGVPALGAGQRRSNQASRWRDKEGSTHVFRAALVGSDRKVLAGHIRGETVQGNVLVSGVALSKRESGGPRFAPGDPAPAAEKLYTLRRFFTLRAVSSHVERPPEREIVQDDAAWLAAYLAQPAHDRDPLDASVEPSKPPAPRPNAIVYYRLGVDASGKQPRIPTDKSRRTWTNVAPLAPDDGAFVQSGVYRKAPRVCLFEDDAGEVWASLQRVPPATIVELFTELGAVLERPVNHDLYYVGREDHDAYGRKHAVPQVRLELGPGWTVLIPHSLLRFNRKPLETMEHNLFHGDRITRVSFWEAEAPATDGPYLLSLDGVEQDFNQARTLYWQRERYRIIHILHLCVRPDDAGARRSAASAVDVWSETGDEQEAMSVRHPAAPTIEVLSVEGIDEHGRGRWLFHQTRARLSPSSQQRLQERIAAMPDEPSSEFMVFARLDSARLRETEGQDVIFDHVRWSFTPGAEGPAAIDDEMLFAEAGDLKETANDIRLQIHPPSFLAQADVAGDAPRLTVTRRTFSVREDLLGRILERRGAAALRGRIYLVRVTREGDELKASLLHNAPRRRAAALAEMLRGNGTWAAVIPQRKLESDARLELELRPGVFVALEPEQLEYSPAAFESWGIVRVDAARTSDGRARFRVAGAAFHDLRYVQGPGGRPAVGLPLPRVADPEEWRNAPPGKWANVRCFTIGGLAGVQAKAAHYLPDRQAWALPSAHAMASLMQAPHPKIVRVGLDENGEVRVAPSEPDWPVGKLQVLDGLQIFYLRLHNGAGHARQPLRWRELTFADEAAAHVYERMRRARWSYHDGRSFRWGRNGNIESVKLDAHTLFEGPVFFERNRTSGLRLRYGDDRLQQLGCNVDDLFADLRARRRLRGCYPVAARSRMEGGGLWVELAPGRVAELPGPLIVHVEHGRETSLAKFHFDGFAPGDLIELQLQLDGLFDVDRVALVDWVPGPRRALGARAVLPCEAFDEEHGALRLGVGAYTLSVPWTEGADDGPYVVDSDNDVRLRREGRFQPPTRGDVVLLVEDDDHDAVRVAGLPELRPFPHRDPELWSGDPLSRYLDVANRGSTERLLALIRGAGGALPVTVEADPGRDNRLFYSLHDVRAAGALDGGTLAFAHVLSMLPDTDQVLLRCGGGLLLLGYRALVGGVPREQVPAVIACLAAARTPIWLRCADHIYSGVRDDAREVEVKALHALPREGDREGGLICRSVDSLRLWWLPASRAAWTTLSDEQLQDTFVPRKPFRAERLRESGVVDAISVIDLPEVRDEHHRLTVGTELVVRVLASIDGPDRAVRRYLVESMQGRVVHICETFSSRSLELGEQILVHVIRRGSTPMTIVVAQPGDRPAQLDLPRWMFRGRNRARDEVSNYLRWRGEPVDPMEWQGIRAPADLGDDDLQRLMCHAMGLPGAPPPQALGVAREWWQRNGRRPELYAPYPVMAALLLKSRLSLTIAQDIGRRALRSMHCEILANALRSPDQGTELRARYQRVRESLSDNAAVRMTIIRQFCRAVELRGQSPLDPIAASLTAALGELRNHEALCSNAQVASSLSVLHFALLKIDKTTDDIAGFYREILSAALRQLTDHALDLVLLDPLSMP